MIINVFSSGTTWLQEIVYLVKTGLDFEGAGKQVLESRFPYLEYPYPGLSTIKKIQGPKMIKTHLPLTLLPKPALENGVKVTPVITIIVLFTNISLLYRLFIFCEIPKMWPSHTTIS